MKKETEYTVKYLREMLKGVPDSAVVLISSEGCFGNATREDSFGYDEEDNTFEIGKP